MPATASRARRSTGGSLTRSGNALLPLAAWRGGGAACYAAVTRGRGPAWYSGGDSRPARRNAMFGLIFTAATLAVAQAPIPSRMGFGDDTRKPKLIAKGEGYLVHALPPLGDPAPFTREGLRFSGD